MVEQPASTPGRILSGLSLPRRIGYVAAGLGGLGGASLAAALWATEPGPLPARTQLAFAALVLLGAGWAGFAGWALLRRPLFAIDRLIAAWMAVCASVLTGAGALAVALARADTAAALTAAAGGLATTGVAVALLIRARTQRALLLARKRELEAGLPVPPRSGKAPGHALPPIGPMAVALRLRERFGGATVALAALVVGLLLVVGILLLR